MPSSSSAKRQKVVVLGGSSPYTVVLVEAIARADYGRCARDLVLFGRNRARLAAVLRYSRHCLRGCEWSVRGTTDLREALDGASVLIHQIRYGGLRGREADERLAGGAGLPADETLGPGGLQSALRAAPFLIQLARHVVELCPDACFVNLTNPLSVTTDILSRHGITRCVGVCELPETTVRSVANLVGAAFEDLSWDYTGLNHRGFVFGLLLNGEPLLPVILEKLKGASFLGIRTRDIAELDAVPLKYFELLTGNAVRNPGRARFLMQLRSKLFHELDRNQTRFPPSMQQRNVDWYEAAVIPLLTALHEPRGTVRVLNLMGHEDIVVERQACVSAEGIVPIPVAHPPAPVQLWIERFVIHERAVVAAALEPAATTVEAALRLDPMVLPSQVPGLREAILRSVAA